MINQFATGNTVSELPETGAITPLLNQYETAAGGNIRQLRSHTTRHLNKPSSLQRRRHA